jgi:hypothetical protein
MMRGVDDETDASPPLLTTFSKDVLRAALVDIVSRSLLAAVCGVAAAVALLVWQGGSVPSWVAALIVVGAAAIVARSRCRISALERRLASRETKIAKLEPLAARSKELEEAVDRYDYGLACHEVYGAHIAEVLDHLQRVVSGDIEVAIPEYIVRGILEPARDVIIEDPGEDVRLSVLLPDTDDDCFVMPWAAGHNLNSQSKYRVPIHKTLARLAFEDGKAYSWADVTEDDRFEANPEASRPLRSMVSIPLRRGDAVIGVFNCVASLPNAFDTAERSYLTSLGSVLSVAVNVWLEREEAEAARR